MFPKRKYPKNISLFVERFHPNKNEIEKEKHRWPHESCYVVAHHPQASWLRQVAGMVGGPSSWSIGVGFLWKFGDANRKPWSILTLIIQVERCQRSPEITDMIFLFGGNMTSIKEGGPYYFDTWEITFTRPQSPQWSVHLKNQLKSKFIIRFVWRPTCSFQTHLHPLSLFGHSKNLCIPTLPPQMRLQRTQLGCAAGLREGTCAKGI